MPYPLSPCNSSYTPTRAVVALDTSEKVCGTLYCDTGSTSVYFLHPTVVNNAMSIITPVND